MKWLLDLIWPKAPVTMEEVGSSRADVPVENVKAPAWKAMLPPGLVLGPSDTMTVVVGPTVPEVESLARQVEALREEVARLKHGRVKSTAHQDALQRYIEWGIVTPHEAAERNLWAEALRKDREAVGVQGVADEPVTVSNGPVVPEVDSLLRQVVSLREEVARVKVEAMGAITEARYENARYHADERGERDALRSGLLELKALVEPMCVECRRQSVEQLRIADRIERMENTDGALVKSVIEHCHRLERVEASAKREMDDHKKWKEQNLYEMMRTENRVTMMGLRYGIAIEALEKANDDKDARLKQIEASFPVGWSTSAWYTKKAGDVWLNVSDRRTWWHVSVTSAREDHSGCLESGPHETMGEAIESAERLGKQLSVEMEDRTVIAGDVVRRECSVNVSATDK